MPTCWPTWRSFAMPCYKSSPSTFRNSRCQNSARISAPVPDHASHLSPRHDFKTKGPGPSGTSAMMRTFALHGFPGCGIGYSSAINPSSYRGHAGVRLDTSGFLLFVPKRR